MKRGHGDAETRGIMEGARGRVGEGKKIRMQNTEHRIQEKVIPGRT